MNLNEALGKSVSLSNIVAEKLRLKENWFTVLSAIVILQNELLNEVRRKVERSN